MPGWADADVWKALGWRPTRCTAVEQAEQAFQPGGRGNFCWGGLMDEHRLAGPPGLTFGLGLDRSRGFIGDRHREPCGPRGTIECFHSHGVLTRGSSKRSRLPLE